MSSKKHPRRSASQTKQKRATWAAVLLVLVLGSAVFTVVSGQADAESGAQPHPSSSSGVQPNTPAVPAPIPSIAPRAALPTTEPSGPATQPASASAREVLTTLAIKGRAPKTGYDRTESFGSAWRDVDKNGCDTRNDILARDLAPIDRPNGCRVLSGQLADPYTGSTIDFVRGNATSQAVQIDHVVALQNAWQTGAQGLSPEQRLAFANDPLNLLAVDGPSNSRKGAGDAATWLPPDKSFRCDYVARQIAVKSRYTLWVTAAEADAMARVLDSCPDQRLPVSS